MMSTPPVKKGELVDLQIEKFADRGKSLAHIDGYVVFVPGSVPGDRVRVRVTRRRRGYAEGRVEELLEPSPLRVTPRCEYFGTCGGCTWQHIGYETQVASKWESVRDAFVHTGGFDLDAEGIELLPAIPADRPFFYRNKMEFSFGAQRWVTDEEIASGVDLDRGFALGMHVPGRFDRVIDLQVCYLQSELSVAIVNATRDIARERGWEPWDVRTVTGYLRHLVIRTPRHTDDVMVNLVTNGYDEDRIGEYAAFLQSRFPEVTTLVNTVNTGVAQVAFGEEARVVYGPGLVRDRIGRFTFEIGPGSFFQTNTEQAEKLYSVALEFAELRPDDLVYDLYSGVGSISLFLAEHARHVVGIELIEEAVVAARRNAELNGVSNATFVVGDMLEVFGEELLDEHGVPDVLVVDPPRSGMHPKVVERIAELGPERLVYVSCNLQTQARDVAMLRDAYRVEVVQPVDLFPQTFHIESVARLRRR
jgi:23S rRNA (uracil1939-C5)-methyltransferase